MFKYKFYLKFLKKFYYYLFSTLFNLRKALSYQSLIIRKLLRFRHIEIFNFNYNLHN